MNWDDELTVAIANEAENIATDYETRGGGIPLVNVLAMVSMCMEAHTVLDELKLHEVPDRFARNFVDEAFAKVLRDRGWRVERPGTA
jgi:hypothetical protein